MNDNLIKCTSKSCIYRKTCGRQIEDEPPSENDKYYNYEYTCNFNSSWDAYVKYIYNEK